MSSSPIDWLSAWFPWPDEEARVGQARTRGGRAPRRSQLDIGTSSAVQARTIARHAVAWSFHEKRERGATRGLSRYQSWSRNERRSR